MCVLVGSCAVIKFGGGTVVKFKHLICLAKFEDGATGKFEV